MAAKTRDLTTLRFTGPRFEDHGLDIDVLPELIAYKELLVETAKSLWRAQNPSRERLPKGFEAGLAIRFYRLDEGSTAVPLKRVIPEDHGNLILFDDELDQAADILEATIDQVANGKPLPSALPKNVIPLFDTLGKTLRAEESIAIQGARSQREVRFTTQIGLQLAKIAEGDYEDSVDVVGEVRATDLDGYSFALREDDGNKVRGYFEAEQESLFTEALKDHAVRRLRVLGTGEFSGASGKLKIIRRVAAVHPVLVAEPLQQASSAPIWDAINRITSTVSEREWDKVPKDGAANLDRYLYGQE